ncbi:hypothetical protein OAO19_02995 [Gammaproteobacteria bacterium]|nr:hypothetical protein [Gammaproteobacteria bacterium]
MSRLSLNAGAPSDFWVSQAINLVKQNFGVDISVEEKGKSLLKFGRVVMNGNTNLHTIEIQADTSIENETFLTANTIDYIVSSSASDTAANSSSDCVVEGQTIDGSGNFTFVSQTVTLTGQTPAALTTPLARCTRWYNDDAAEVAGAISIYESSVTTITAGSPSAGYTGVHLTTRAGGQQSEKCSTTVSNNDYWIVTGVYGDVLSKSSEDIEFNFEVRLKGKVFRQQFEFSASNGIGTFRTAPPYVVIPANSDVRIRAKCDGSFTGTLDVGAGMFGILATVV